jgi:hypothetical protein
VQKEKPTRLLMQCIRRARLPHQLLSGVFNVPNQLQENDLSPLLAEIALGEDCSAFINSSNRTQVFTPSLAVQTCVPR